MKTISRWQARSEGFFSGDRITELPMIAEKLLRMRGIETREEAERFLCPSLGRLHDPFLMDGMEKAAQRIIAAIARCERICIYGDYDVDGITSVAALYNFLEETGADVIFYVPDRIRDGFGLSVDALKQVLERSPSLIISVDCGTTSVDEVMFLKDMDIDIIITDHHEAREKVPDALAVLNPALPGSGYPFRKLSGVGVVYKLISAICERLGIQGREQSYLDLTAVGTIADVVSLEDENRILTWHGLKKINKCPNTGLELLIRNFKASGRKIDEETVGFVIAPRINAAGRLSDPARSVRLFLTDDREEAARTVDYLYELNRERQSMQEMIIKEVEGEIAADKSFISDNVLVVSGKGWHHGIIGIVASVIAERHGKPAFVITVGEEGKGKGSARSDGSFNLFEALSDSAGLLEAYGGHEKAAGFTLDASRIEDLRKRINQYFDAQESRGSGHVFIYDMLLDEERIDTGTVEAIELLAPFGEGNPKPLFGFTGMKVKEASLCGNEGRHLKLRLGNSRNEIDCIAFNAGSIYDDLSYGNRVDVLGYLQINEWRKMKRIQLQISEIKRCE